MGNGMNKVLPGLYVGNYRDSKDPQQLDRYNITHIIAIHDSPRRLLQDKHYLCIMASDTPDQNLSQYFTICNDFIHAARLRDGNVLIHCLAGMSRSVTVAVAYIMSVTNLPWKDALKVVRTKRSVANPNLGFRTQLQDFEQNKLMEERRRLKERFPSVALEIVDKEQCTIALNKYEQLLYNKDICEGNCVRGQNCPTGLCNTEHNKPGIFRRKSSTSSIRSQSYLQGSSGAQQTVSGGITASCPTSPRPGSRKYSRSINEFSKQSSLPSSSSTTPIKIMNNNSKSIPYSMSSTAIELHRSSSTISGFRYRSNPNGLYSYTGSAPPSVHGSRVDLTNISSCGDKGSAIYLGCTPPKSTNINSTGSTWSVTKSTTVHSSGSTSQTPLNTLPNSPKHRIRRPPSAPSISTTTNTAAIRKN